MNNKWVTVVYNVLYTVLLILSACNLSDWLSPRRIASFGAGLLIGNLLFSIKN